MSLRHRSRILIAVVLLAGLAWQNKVELLVWGMPKVRDLVSPIPANVPTQWALGPEAADLPPEDRPPNIIFILTDDQRFEIARMCREGRPRRAARILSTRSAVIPDSKSIRMSRGPSRRKEKPR